MANNIPDRVMRDIIKAASAHGIERVILFGSRARGTNSQRSDIDIAVSGGDCGAFADDIKENAHTLLTFDVVELDKGVSKELLAEIERDGVTIYEKA